MNEVKYKLNHSKNTSDTKWLGSFWRHDYAPKQHVYLIYVGESTPTLKQLNLQMNFGQAVYHNVTSPCFKTGFQKVLALTSS